MGDSLRAGSDYNTRLYEGKGWWVRNVFNMILFPYLFDEKCKTKKEPIFSTGKCESVLSTFSIPLYQNDQEGELASYSRVRSLPSLPRSLSPMLKKGNPLENEEGPRIFLSTVLLGAPPPSLNKYPLA